MPVIDESSSAPEPDVSPEKEPGSLTGVTEVEICSVSAENDDASPLVETSICSPTTTAEV